MFGGPKVKINKDILERCKKVSEIAVYQLVGFR